VCRDFERDGIRGFKDGFEKDFCCELLEFFVFGEFFKLFCIVFGGREEEFVFIDMVEFVVKGFDEGF
jgi:hypothetical protein